VLASGKFRIAVVSPFLDKQHGTERCVVEQVERLAHDCEVHVYSNRVEDIDAAAIVWHRIPALPGPHLFAYCWWFLANQLWRWWDQRVRGLRYDLIYTPCINCLDADVISVHIVFSEFYERVRDDLKLRRNPVKTWPRLVHRRLYYALITMLERRCYTREDISLVAVSRKVRDDLQRFYERKSQPSVVYYGSDLSRFGRARRAGSRPQARRLLGLAERAFAVLLIGNDWKKKGLPCLLEAVARLDAPDLCILAVGADTIAPYASAIRRHGLQSRVRFLPIRPDVEFYYAAADAYVGPSLEDAFAMPPLEAMACGLPVIVSRQAGVSEVVTHGVDGLVLEDPRDTETLASLIGDLHRDVALKELLGKNAAQTAQHYTWDRNAEQLRAVIEEILNSRHRLEPYPIPASR
jgi:glycosyltransferase involved in cell wall biosynthesis